MSPSNSLRSRRDYVVRATTPGCYAFIGRDPEGRVTLSIDLPDGTATIALWSGAALKLAEAMVRAGRLANDAPLAGPTPGVPLTTTDQDSPDPIEG